MHPGLAEFESAYVSEVKDALKPRMAGNPSGVVLEVAAQVFCKPLLMAAGKLNLFREMMVHDREGNFSRSEAQKAYIPFTVLLSAFDFANQEAIKSLLQQSSYSVAQGLGKQKVISGLSDQEGILLGVVYASDKVIKLGSQEDQNQVSVVEGDPKLGQLPSGERSQALMPAVEMIEISETEKLHFYGYAGLRRERELGISRKLQIYAITDTSHDYLPAFGQTVEVPIYNPHIFTPAQLLNIKRFHIASFPESSAAFNESERKQLAGGVLYSAKLTYLAEAHHYPYQTLAAIVATALRS